MPCLKLVGQIILGMDPLAGAIPPEAIQSCANSLVKMDETKGNARASRRQPGQGFQNNGGIKHLKNFGYCHISLQQT